MARPKPTITLSQEQPNGDIWQITEYPRCYVITYKDQLFAVRVIKPRNIDTVNIMVKYKKLSYPTLGSAQRQIRTLNKMFNCKDFAYKII